MPADSQAADPLAAHHVAGRRLVVARGGWAFVVALMGLIPAVAVTAEATASAHANLVSSQPSAGAILGPAPAAIILHFSEGVVAGASSVTLLRPNGQSIPLTALAYQGSDRTTVTATTLAGTAGGPVEVHWTSVAADDGHTVTGEYALTVAAPTAPPAPAVGPAPPAAAPPDTTGVAAVFAAVRMLSYLSIALLCGGLAFLALIWPEGAEVARSRTLLYSAWVVGMATAGLGLGLEGATANLKPLSAIFSPSLIGTVLTTKFGRVWAGKGLLFLVALPLLWALTTQGARAVRSPGWRIAVVAVGLGLVRTPGLIGHSSEASHAVLGSIADLIHLTGVALWIGGLVFLALVVVPRRRPEELAHISPRFSTLAMASVAAIVVAGTFMAWQLIGSWHGLFDSAYGHVLLVKLTAFAAVMGLAQASRHWVNHRLDLAVALDGDAVTVRPYLISVAAEVTLAVVILIVASVLVSTNPIR